MLAIVGVHQLEGQLRIGFDLRRFVAGEFVERGADVEELWRIELSHTEDRVDVVGQLTKSRFVVAQRGLRCPLLGNVPDGRNNDRIAVIDVAGKTDFDWERRAVRTPAAKRQARPHRTRLRIFEKRGAMLRVTVTDIVGDEHLKAGANQFLPRIAEDCSDLGVDQRN